ncbi:uncharacterized protein LOC116613106 [Nematostella vectensis]|uniref:uncharacterized protein LOC116613106 n=1 Tax=Nematostella vectensis TaxID=45351 RepID=UPI002076F88E|nr:uncharacterized protein LOC116613106 [Nematostella vectensis]
MGAYHYMECAYARYVGGKCGANRVNPRNVQCISIVECTSEHFFWRVQVRTYSFAIPHITMENKRSNQKNANAKRSHKKSNKSTAVNGAKQSGSVQQEHRKPSEVVIAGDSMIKYINGWNLSNASQRVNVKSFSGARVSDMADYIKPLIRKKPESIVLHIGTNDLRDSEPHNVADGVVDLAHQIESADISVAVSGLITRSDSEELTGRVKETNRLLRSFCNQNGWEFVPNTNITSAHLNTKGLHLNKSGTQVHVSLSSAIADHCSTYALSDVKEESFSSSCHHVRDQSVSSARAWSM